MVEIKGIIFPISDQMRNGNIISVDGKWYQGAENITCTGITWDYTNSPVKKLEKKLFN